MTKPDMSRLVKNVRRTMAKRSPEILTGIGIAGMITTTVLAVKATPKAIQLANDLKRIDSNTCEIVYPTKKEVVKACWKCYIPAAVTGVASVTCLIYANSINAKRNAALAAAYTLSDTALREYKAKVVETIGEKKEQVVREKIAQDKVDKDPVSKTELIITEKGNTLCYDAISGRYFKSDIDKIKRAINELNRRMLYEMYISLTEFYNELGLTGTSLSDELGWNLDDGLIEVDFSSQIADDGTPCIVVDYMIAPRYNYSKLM